MMPATRTETTSKSTSMLGPTNAPKAPASFQSPAPRLRTKTKGSSTSKPNPAPSRDVFKPPNPLAIAFAAIPTSSPGTVSQFGIRRLRQSIRPAAIAKAAANPKTRGFKPAPLLAGMRRPKSLFAEVAELASFFDNAGAAGEGKLTPRHSSRLQTLLTRIFTQPDGEVNELPPPSTAMGSRPVPADSPKTPELRCRCHPRSTGQKLQRCCAQPQCVWHCRPAPWLAARGPDLSPLQDPIPPALSSLHPDRKRPQRFPP